MWEILSILVRSVSYVLITFISGYVLLYGKKGTGIKRDYFLTMLILILTIWVASL